MNRTDAALTLLVGTVFAFLVACFFLQGHYAGHLHRKVLSVNITVFELLRWAVANVIALGFWYFIGSSLVRPLREVWPGVVDLERKPMVTRKLHVYIISFAMVCEIALMIDSVALMSSSLAHYGWAK